ncbi:hypothetical protein [Salinimicrobium xinjiangense]|uniref:hypothetical protein n=1 Tax=Salinimicrobium xinjiangense TaxID=438596 RepID=UPI0004007710|nr:hypothetical protein [Salinimicrobium xinjiangense]
MEPEKFENNVKKVLREREIQPSAAGWNKLEQRLEKKREKRPYFAWIASAAAIAAIFFVLGTFFDAPIASEEPQLVEQEPAQPVLEEKNAEPEVIQIAASEEKEELKEEKKPSAERSVKNAIFETPVPEASEAEEQIAAQILSEAPAVKEPEENLHLAEHQPEFASQDSAYNSDLEVEALLLLATAELKPDSNFTVNSGDLLHQVEYELDQSFRQKVFEVVKEGFSKAKTAVANRDF